VLLIGLVLAFRHHGHFVVYIIIGSLLILLGIFIPKILKPFQKIWMGLALVLGFIVTHVIVTIFSIFA